MSYEHLLAPGRIGALDLRNRSHALVSKVAHAIPGTRNRLLNWASYQFGGMIAEGVIMRDAAEKLLRGARKCAGYGARTVLCSAWRRSAAGLMQASGRMKGRDRDTNLDMGP